MCLPSLSQCGCSYEQPYPSQFKIVGGYPAKKHSWPWIVSIRQTNNHQPLTDPGIAICVGSIINKRYILTAAHCFYRFNHLIILSDYFVVIGAHYINDTNKKRYTIESIKIHPEYNDDVLTNDIALLKVSYDIDFSNTEYGFICLPNYKKEILYPYKYMNGTVIGWGFSQENGTVSYELQQVDLPIISNDSPHCKKQLIDERSQFCAGFIDGGRDACQGDSGGPYMVYDADLSTWHIAGIVSYGHGCARHEYPGVYTRVNIFIDWVNQNINTLSSQSPINSLSIQFLLFTIFRVLFF